MSSELLGIKNEGKKKPKYPDQHSEETNDDQRNWYKKLREKWRNMTPANRFIVSFTGVTAFCTLVYAVVSCFMLSSLRESNCINRQALKSVQRAFVSVRRVEINPIAGENPKEAVAAQFDLGWENPGSTPAKHVTQHISTRWDATPIPETFDFPDEWTAGESRQLNPTYIAPKGFLGGGIFSVPASVLKQVHSGTTHVNYWGWNRYTDVFGQQHITEFCFELKSNGMPFTLQNGFPFRLEECQKHNCIDEDCEIKH